MASTKHKTSLRIMILILNSYVAYIMGMVIDLVSYFVKLYSNLLRGVTPYFD